jgi:REP element-mobilizing transposase RayT
MSTGNFVFPKRRRLHHITPWNIQAPEFFLTVCCAQPGVIHLCKDVPAGTVLDAAHHYHCRKLWHCELMVLMPDHLHAILSVGKQKSLEAVIKSWKGWTARVAGIQWQDGFFEHRLRSPSSAQQKWHYVNQNPVRKGLVKKAEDWPWRFMPGRAHHP